MLFFDLEFYVPKNDRPTDSRIFAVNPNMKGHKLLGGAFYSKKFDEKIAKHPDCTQLWLWDHEDERRLLETIYKLFREEKEKTAAEQKKILNKPINSGVDP